MKKRIIVSHPGKQYVHQLLYALEQQQSLLLFYATIWFKKNDFLVKTALKLFPFTISTFKKRYFEPLDDSKIRINFIPEIIRLLLSKIFAKYANRWVFLTDRMHDNWVSGKLDKVQYDMLIAFENSSYKSLAKAKEMGKITVLDLAQVHYKFISEVRNKYPEFKSRSDSESHFKRVNRLKKVQDDLVDYFFVLSKLARESLLSAGVSESKIYTLSLGFNPSIFKQKDFYKKDGDQFILLFVGTVSRRKGVHLAIEAFKKLNLKNSSFKLVGPISDGGEFLENLPSNISHTPFLHHEDLVKYYQEADIFVFPSYLDSWAMVVIEAMACGTPVIITENTGSKDAVASGGGFIIPTGSIGELMLKIQYCFDNRSFVEQEGRKAHIIAQRYTWTNYYSQVQSAINDIFKKSNLE